MTRTRTGLYQDDDVLLERAGAGDHEAFGELVRRHQRRIWLVCRQYVGADEAETATQETFVKAFAKLGAFDRRAALTTWLTRIAINTCLDQLRRRRREGLRVEDQAEDGEGSLARLPAAGASPEERAMQHEAVERLRELERALPERQRAVYRLRFYAELELEEIASALEVKVGTVKTQLHRAVHRLRRELGDVR